MKKLKLLIIIFLLLALVSSPIHTIINAEDNNFENVVEIKTTTFELDVNSGKLSTNDFIKLANLSLLDKDNNSLLVENYNIVIDDSKVNYNFPGVYNIKVGVEDNAGDIINNNVVVVINDGNFNVGKDYALYAKDFIVNSNEVKSKSKEQILNLAGAKVYSTLSGEVVDKQINVDGTAYTNKLGTYKFKINVEDTNVFRNVEGIVVKKPVELDVEAKSFSIEKSTKTISDERLLKLTGLNSVVDDYKVVFDKSNVKFDVVGDYKLKVIVEDKDDKSNRVELSCIVSVIEVKKEDIKIKSSPYELKVGSSEPSLEQSIELSNLEVLGDSLDSNYIVNYNYESVNFLLSGIYSVVITLIIDNEVVITQLQTVVVNDGDYIVNGNYALYAKDFSIASYEVNSKNINSVIFDKGNVALYDLKTGLEVKKPISIDTSSFVNQTGLYGIEISCKEFSLSKNIYITITDKIDPIDDVIVLEASNFNVVVDSKQPNKEETVKLAKIKVYEKYRGGKQVSADNYDVSFDYSAVDFKDTGEYSVKVNVVDIRDGRSASDKAIISVKVIEEDDYQPVVYGEAFELKVGEGKPSNRKLIDFANIVVQGADNKLLSSEEYTLLAEYDEVDFDKVGIYAMSVIVIDNRYDSNNITVASLEIRIVNDYSTLTYPYANFSQFELLQGSEFPSVEEFLKLSNAKIADYEMIEYGDKTPYLNVGVSYAGVDTNIVDTYNIMVSVEDTRFETTNIVVDYVKVVIVRTHFEPRIKINDFVIEVGNSNPTYQQLLREGRISVADYALKSVGEPYIDVVIDYSNVNFNVAGEYAVVIKATDVRYVGNNVTFLRTKVKVVDDISVYDKNKLTQTGYDNLIYLLAIVSVVVVLLKRFIKKV